MTIIYNTLGICYVDQTVYVVNMIASFLLGLLVGLIVYKRYIDVQEKKQSK